MAQQVLVGGTITPPVHPETAALLAMLASQPKVDPGSIPIATVRGGYDKMLETMFDSGLSDESTGAVVCAPFTVVPSSSAGVPVNVYVPPGCTGKALPVLLYMHGGGWTQGTPSGYDGFTRALCARGGFAVVSVDYRLAPEHPSPAAADDCMAALRWIADGAAGCEALNPATGKLALAGDSAGGHLTAVCAVMARDEGVPISIQVPLCPVTDLRGPVAAAPGRSYTAFAEGYLLTTERMEWFLDNYVPDVAARSSPTVSPLLHNHEGLAGVAPAIVVTADHDPLCDEGRAYARALNAAGVATECELSSCHRLAD